MSSDEGETNSEDEYEEVPPSSQLPNLYIPPSQGYTAEPAFIEQPSPRPASETPVTPTPAAVTKTPVASKPPSPGFSIPKMFPKRANTPRSLSFDSTTTMGTTPGPMTAASSTGALSPSPSGGATPVARPQVNQQKSKFRKSWGNKGKDFNFNAANDILGIVMLEIQGAHDLPKLKNSERDQRLQLTDSC